MLKTDIAAVVGLTVVWWSLGGLPASASDDQPEKAERERVEQREQADHERAQAADQVAREREARERDAQEREPRQRGSEHKRAIDELRGHLEELHAALEQADSDEARADITRAIAEAEHRLEDHVAALREQRARPEEDVDRGRVPEFEGRRPGPPRERIRDLFRTRVRELQERRERFGGEGRRRPEELLRIHEAMQQMESLRVAADNLDRAGRHELAEELRRDAAQMERDIHGAQERLEGGRPEFGEPAPAEPFRELHGAIEDLRAEVERLRRDVDHLRALVGEREDRGRD